MRNARLAARLTLSEVAEGVTTAPYLSRIEAGERRPSGPLLEELARRLRMDVGYLTRGERTVVCKLQFELTHADALLASEQFTDAYRVSRDLAEIARSVDTPQIADAASIVGADALAAMGEREAALRAVSALESGPMSVLAMAAATRYHVGLADYRRAIRVGQVATDLLTGPDRASLPETAALAVSLAGAYEGVGRPHEAARVAANALGQLGADLGEPEFEVTTLRENALLAFYGSFQDFAAHAEYTVARIQAAELGADVQRLLEYAALDCEPTSAAPYALAQMAVR